MQFTDQPNVAFPNFILVRTFAETENLNYDLATIIRRHCTTVASDGLAGGFCSADDFLDIADAAVVTLKGMIGEACSAYLSQALPAV